MRDSLEKVLELREQVRTGRRNGQRGSRNLRTLRNLLSARVARIKGREESRYIYKTLEQKDGMMLDMINILEKTLPVNKVNNIISQTQQQWKKHDTLLVSEELVVLTGEEWRQKERKIPEKNYHDLPTLVQQHFVSRWEDMEIFAKNDVKNE